MSGRRGGSAPAPTGERVQKVLARAGVASRRKSEELIREGRVTLNGRSVELGDRVQGSDVLKVDGRQVRTPSRHRYLLLNKPDQVLTTRDDPEGRPTVLDLIPPGLHKALVPVGRLDYHTQGLILLSTDGDFCQRVAHPSHGCTKTYEVKVKGEPSEESIAKLRAGLVLKGRKSAPVRIRRFRSAGRGKRKSQGNTWWTVELQEGRTRQIREMFARVGHPVQRLRRVAIGSLRDPDLAPGHYRELTPDEVEELRGGAPPKKKRTRKTSR